MKLNRFLVPDIIVTLENCVLYACCQIRDYVKDDGMNEVDIKMILNNENFYSHHINFFY